MSQDRLFLIEPGFVRPNRDPHARFVCPDCNLLEGLLATDPARAAQALQVQRVPFERPRQAVIDLLGPEHQGLPVLVLGDEHPAPADALSHGTLRFVDDPARIAALLAERHGFYQL